LIDVAEFLVRVEEEKRREGRRDEERERVGYISSGRSGLESPTVGGSRE
jgi:hypothetical protein